MARECYQCKKEIKDVEGKYFCNRECWEAWQKENYKEDPKRRSLTIKEIQKKLIEMGKTRKFDPSTEEFWKI